MLQIYDEIEPELLKCVEDLIEIEDGVMAGYEIKRKEGKRVSAPASFTAAYPDARFECITPANLMEFLM